MESLQILSSGQYSLVYNMLSLTIAAMGASTVFFFLSRGSVLPKYRPALIVSGLVTLIACYHYFRIFLSWTGAFELGDMGYVASGEPFNDAYRYVDWLLTVPLLLFEAVAVLALAPAIRKSLLLNGFEAPMDTLPVIERELGLSPLAPAAAPVAPAAPPAR
jgi:bacteriorhodopsin